ncbi:MAG: (2Fe-2S)-binding protein [Granulosicoccus sp.]|nr:(2Fe-2S)-binding protein [Granulosicoccus sp.]
MNHPCRLAAGGEIDRKRVINFRFNGKLYQGNEGDTLASALLANGVRLTARSFKYHRPRGIIGAGYEEPGTLVELRHDEESGNQPVTTIVLREGLEAVSVNCWPSPKIDFMAVNQFFARIIPAAFYYKTFKWPNWHLFEPSIRRAAGLANAPSKLVHKGHYEIRNAYCDLLVIGAGPVGLVSALIAGRTGARVMLADDGLLPGGSLLSQRMEINGADKADWLSRVVAELDAMKNVTRLSQATAWAYREHNLVMITERNPDQSHVFQRSWRVRSKQVIIATGAIERHLVFANNDRPGVMLASAIQSYVNRYAACPGNRVVLFGNNSSVYSVARDLLAADIKIAAIVDSRGKEHAIQKGLGGVRIYSNCVVEQCTGGRNLTGVVVRNQESAQRHQIDCDLLGVSGGWNPAVHLYSQSRGLIQYNADLATFVPGKAAQNCQCLGAAAGIFSFSEGIQDAISKVSNLLNVDSEHVEDMPEGSDEVEYHVEPLWFVDVNSKLAAKSFVDIQNDVTLADIFLSMREGFDAVEHVKRYTTAGMGIDQGKTGNINVIGAIAMENGMDIDQIGTTTFRSPYVPIEFGAMTGVREESVYLPYRHTPVTGWHTAQGATMYEAGARWRRPGYYPQTGESFQETVNRESLATREKVSVYDGAPLGKFEIKGPDSLKLIEMLYTNDFASLEQGMGRYGIMLTEDGLILDDGVTFKLADNHYFMSTSTGNADRVNQHMEFFLQTHRPEWQVYITTVTTQWANATICGPQARDLLNALGTDIDLANAQFPFMSYRDGTVAGLPARVCRVSFTGELSFEINVSSRNALALWKKIIEAGGDFDLTPIGSEANHVLRVEKGFLSLGHEADGTTDPYDLGMSWIMSKTKSDYVGKKSLEIRQNYRSQRRQLVGLLPDDPNHLIDENSPITPGGKRVKSEGLVTACVWSVVQNRVIALALLQDGRNRMGETVYVRRKGHVVTAKVTKPCFHDPKGELLRG